MTSVHLAFSVSSGDSNSGPLACKASFLIHGTISLALFLWIFDPATALCFSLLMNIDFSTSYQMLCFMVCVCGGGDTGILNFILYQMQSNKGMWLFLFFCDLPSKGREDLVPGSLGQSLLVLLL